MDNTGATNYEDYNINGSSAYNGPISVHAVFKPIHGTTVNIIASRGTSASRIKGGGTATLIEWPSLDETTAF